MNQFKNEHYRRGYADGHAGKPCQYNRYFPMGTYLDTMKDYHEGWHDGRQEVLDDYREECKADWQRTGEDE